MLGNNRRQLELAFSLLFSLPGTPMMQYGDEIGIGDNLRLPERECARTPMQWTSERHGGFSVARKVVRPVIDDAVYGYERVNVADQQKFTNAPKWSGGLSLENSTPLANGGNLMFCEDAARRIHQALSRNPDYADFHLRVEHQESLHAHDAVAYASKAGVPRHHG